MPAETQLRGAICLLGLDVPFLLRNIDGDTYIVIGEAYIHGATDGEIVSTRDASETQQLRELKLQ